MAGHCGTEPALRLLSALRSPEREVREHGVRAARRSPTAFAACRSGNILFVTKLGRLARSLPDAHDILTEPSPPRTSASASADPSTTPPTRSGGSYQSAGATLAGSPKAAGRLTGMAVSRSRMGRVISEP